MFNRDISYSTVNTAKYAIATNKLQLRERYMTRIFNLRPPKPESSTICDDDILFE